MYRKAHATGGAGGVVYTRNEDLYRMVRAYSDRGKPFWRTDYDEKDPAQFLFPALNLHQDEISCVQNSRFFSLFGISSFCPFCCIWRFEYRRISRMV